MTHKIFLFFIILVISTSCASKRNMLLFQDAEVQEKIEKDIEAKPGLVYIRPYDILYIEVKTMDPQLNKMFEDQARTAVRTGAATGALGGYYYWGYLVDHEGFVDLPLLGRVQVSALTIRQARDLISNLLKNYVVEPYVELKFLTFKVYMFGEINRPGLVTVPNETSNLIEVLSLAGDLTDFANRKRIKILRGDPRNPQVFVIDLTKTQSFYSGGFYLKPNDIVYVEPMNRKWVALMARDLSFVLTFVNAALLVINILSRDG